MRGGKLQNQPLRQLYPCKRWANLAIEVIALLTVTLVIFLAGKTVGGTVARLALAVLFCSAPAWPQNALYVDLSGDWRQSTEDRPEYALPGYDDSSWGVAKLPWTKRPPDTVFWLRKSATLPAGADRTKLALTLGSLSEAYVLYVNGVEAGRFGGFDHQQARVPRPYTFALPAAAIQSDGPIRIAVRIWARITRGTSSWRLFREGPYVLTYAGHFPADYGDMVILRQMARRWPDVALGAMQFVLALAFMGLWCFERRRLEILWVSLFLLSDAVGTVSAALLLHPASHPWSHDLRNLILPPLRGVLFVEVVMAVFALQRGWLRALAVPAAMSASLLRMWERPDYYRVLSGAPWVMGIAVIGVGLWQAKAPRDQKVRGGMAGLLAVLAIASLNRYNLLSGWLPNATSSDFAVTNSLAVGTLMAMFLFGLLLYEFITDRRERQRLTSELEAARAVQQLLVPPSGAGTGVFHLEAIYEPAQEVGGDFHWSRLDADGSLLVVVGDVSGKGLQAAMLVSVIIGMLRTVPARAPGAVLQALNDGLCGQTGGGFVTCCCARFAPDNAMSIANGGHLAPYVDQREVAVEAGLPLGVVADAAYTEAEVTLAPGARFVMLSDGVVEAANKQGELFGFDRSREVSALSTKEIAAAAKAWGQNDDLTVVTVRRRG